MKKPTDYQWRVTIECGESDRHGDFRCLHRAIEEIYVPEDGDVSRK